MKKVRSLVAIAAAIATAACSTHTAQLSYSEFKAEMPMKESAWDGENLGTVAGEDGGAIWNNCTEKARGSIREMITTAKNRGANAVGDIRWTATNSPTPSCKKGWGYFLIWPFILTPLFMSTQVKGTAYKVAKASKASAGVLLLPTNAQEEEAFIDRVMAAE